jgi:hypothetical protein
MQMSIFRGSPSALTCIQSAPSPSGVGSSWTSATFSTVAGECIYLLVDGFAGDQCNYSFTLTNLSGGCIILPVGMIDFTAEARGKKSILQWTMEGETFNEAYTVERSTDAINFSTVGTVLPQNKAGITAYQFTDGSPVNGTNYYRIRYVSESGNVKYSVIRSVYFGKPGNAASVYPTIVSDQLNVVVNDFTKVMALNIISSNGSIVRTVHVNKNNNTINTSSLASGLYYMVIRYNNGSIEQTKFIKQ